MELKWLTRAELEEIYPPERLCPCEQEKAAVLQYEAGYSQVQAEELAQCSAIIVRCEDYPGCLPPGRAQAARTPLRSGKPR